VLSGDDDLLKTNASAAKSKTSAGDDAEGEAVSSTEPMHRRRPNLPLLVRSLQVLHLLVGTNGSVH
jgi:hypothetical protein